MVNDRQQVTDDLARLTQQCAPRRANSRPRNRRLPAKLRSALDGMDENDLGTRMQRSSDWLRSGDFSDPAETALTSDLQKLGQQVSDAARAVGSAQHTSEDAALNRAMDDLSRLRDQLAGLGGRPNGQPGTRVSRRPGGNGSSQTGPATGLARSTTRATQAKTASPVRVVKGQAGSGQPGGQQGGQRGQATWAGQGGRVIKAAEARVITSATASPVRWAIRPVAGNREWQRRMAL
jgi:hypothetical protein